MNNFDDWSQIIAKYLHAEADPLSSLTKHELEDDAARAAFVHAVLDRFLPEIYGVGAGQIMDSRGRLSSKMDIIIYRRDFPRLDLPGSRDIYLYESVIATVEVVGKLLKKSFFDALDQCASIGDLTPDIDPKVINALAAKNQLTMNENRQYIHPDPMRTARFNLIGRPLSFIYGFNGYKTSPNQLFDTLQGWMNERIEDNHPVEMKDLPAVVATHGCFAWRNSAPIAVKQHCLMGVGTDAAPVRLIVLQLLHALSRRLKVTTDGYGLRPGLDAYLNRMPPPKMELFVGKPRNPGSFSATNNRNNRTEQIKEAAKVMNKPASKTISKNNQLSSASKTRPVAQTQKAPAKTSQPEPVKMDTKAPTAGPNAKSLENSTAEPEFEIKARPSHAQSSPIADAVKDTKPMANRFSGLNPKPRAVDAPFPVPNADMIPELDPNPAGDDETEIAVASDRLAATIPATDSVENNFMDAVKAPAQKKPEVSAEAHLKTVKMKIVSSEPVPHLQPESEPEPEPFTSTIPQ